jgi:hypothetical protein
MECTYRGSFWNRNASDIDSAVWLGTAIQHYLLASRQNDISCWARTTEQLFPTIPARVVLHAPHHTTPQQTLIQGMMQPPCSLLAGADSSGTVNASMVCVLLMVECRPDSLWWMDCWCSTQIISGRPLEPTGVVTNFKWCETLDNCMALAIRQ